MKRPARKIRPAPHHQKSTCTRGHSFKGHEPCPSCWPGYRTFTFKAKVWLYPGAAAWHFITVPKKASQEIQKRFEDLKRGWGSLPVEVTIGKMQWATSIFPDKKCGAYLLPIKKEVRKAEHIKANDTLKIDIKITV